MSSDQIGVQEDDPNRRVYRAYVSSGAFGVSPQVADDLAPRSPYLQRLVAKLFPSDRQASVIDLGCGDGALLAIAREAGYSRVAGVDLSPEQVAIARGRGLTAIAEGEIIAYLRGLAAGSTDVIVAFDVLEHCTKQDLLTVIGEVHRVLGAGGRFIVHVPNGQSPFFGRIRYGDFTHELAFTPKSLAAVLRIGGFSAIDCFEDQPIPHGAVSLIRLLLWKVVRNLWRFAYLVETGERDNPILSQNFLALAVKPR